MARVRHYRPGRMSGVAVAGSAGPMSGTALPRSAGPGVAVGEHRAVGALTVPMTGASP